MEHRSRRRVDAGYGCPDCGQIGVRIVELIGKVVWEVAHDML